MKKSELSKRIRQGMKQAAAKGKRLGAPPVEPPQWRRRISRWDGKNYRRLAEDLGTSLGSTYRLVQRWREEQAAL